MYIYILYIYIHTIYIYGYIHIYTVFLYSTFGSELTFAKLYSLLHLECHLNSISNLNLLGLFSTERGKRDLED